MIVLNQSLHNHYSSPSNKKGDSLKKKGGRLLTRMLSRGTSGPKRLREGGKSFGKPIDPNCLRQRALFAATETKKRKQNGKLLPDACSYPASHDGQDCCKGFWCSEPGYYSQGLVRDLRMFLFRLSIADKNLFIDKRMTFDPKANNTKGAKGYTHYLENPQCLAKLLVDANISGCCSLPRPHATEMTPVCSKWFRWAVGVSGSVLGYPAHTFGERTARNFEPSTDTKVGKPYFATIKRDCPKTDLVVAWFTLCKELYLIMPTDSTTVLPFTSCKDTHAHFVLEMEEASGCAWAGIMRDKFNMTKPINDDHEVEDEEVVDPDDIAPNRFEQDDLRYRYGNSYLGELDGTPLAPNICSYKWFCKTWKEYEPCASCKVLSSSRAKLI